MHNGVHNRVVNGGPDRVVTGKYGQVAAGGLSTKATARRTKSLKN